jgi:Caspase domain
LANWAIVVGINQYRTRTGQRPLNGAVDDACDFAEWALDPLGGNVAPDRLYFWAHPWPTPNPQHARLIAYLGGTPPDWYSSDDEDMTAPIDRTRAPNADEIVLTGELAGNLVREARYEGLGDGADRIYVFLAGHGMRLPVYGEDARQTCFVAQDFRAQGSNLASGLVPCESFRRTLRNGRFDEVVMFLDCCRTDPSATMLKAQPISDLSADAQEQGWSVGHAAHENGRAYETLGPPVRGAFSTTLMDGLRGWRHPATQSLNADELQAYVRANISSSTQEIQKPYFDFLPRDPCLTIVTGEATIVLPNPAGPLVHIDALEAGTSLEVVDANDIVFWQGGPFAAGTPAISLPPMPAGFYSLRVVGDPAREALFRHPNEDNIYVPD